MSVVKTVSPNSNDFQFRTYFVTGSLTIQCNPDFSNLQQQPKLVRKSGSSRCQGETKGKKIQGKGLWFELSGGLRNRGFEESGIYYVIINFKSYRKVILIFVVSVFCVLCGYAQARLWSFH